MPVATARHLVALIVGAVSLALALWALLSPGLALDVGGVHLTIRSPVRPFVVAGVAAAILIASSPRGARWWDVLARLADTHALGLSVAMATIVAGAGVRYGSFVASAADSYGYVAEARLFAQGRLSLPQPWAQGFAWPNAAGVWTPLGFWPSPDGTAIVPTYPPGFPLLMAAAQWLGGAAAGYLVVPVAGALAVIATFLLGRRLDDTRTGLLAAVLLACSPALLFHVCLPMSDVPATAAWSLAILLALRRSPAVVVASGLCAGLACLIRPNLAPLLIAALLALTIEFEPAAPTWTRRALLFVAGLVPAGLLLALFHTRWYGSPLGTSHQLGDLFRIENLWPNLMTYPTWLIDTHTIFILLAPLGIFAVRRGRTLLAIVPVTVATCYAFYSPFDHWTYLRFLLPAFPAVFILLAAAVRRGVERLPPGGTQVIALTLVAAVALTSWQQARVRGAFSNHENLQRFVTVPRFIRAQLPDNAVVLTRVYSGSIREYGERLTLRWDVLDPQWLDRAIQDLQSLGHAVFIVIEDEDERARFVSRFAAANAWGSLDWPATAEYRGVDTVWIYDVADRGRAASITPRLIPTGR